MATNPLQKPRKYARTGPSNATRTNRLRIRRWLVSIAPTMSRRASGDRLGPNTEMGPDNHEFCALTMSKIADCTSTNRP